MNVTTVKHFSGRQARSFSAAFKWCGMIFALAAGLSTSSCALLNFPSAPELTLVKVEALAPPYKRYVVHELPPTRYESPFLDASERLHEPILLISITSSRNLLRLSDTHALPIHLGVSTCPFQWWPGLLQQGSPYIGNVEAEKFVSTIRNSKNSKERYAEIDAYDPPAHDKFYTLLVLPKYDSSRYGPVSSITVNGDKVPLIRIYDMYANHQDICIKIRGFSMLGYGFESTILTVPKEQIISALQQPISE